MNPSLFWQDLTSCIQAPWRLSQRARALLLLVLERWNAYSPLRIEPVFPISIVHKGVPLRILMGTSQDGYTAFRELFLERMYDYPFWQPRTILDLGANCGCATLAFAAAYPDASIAAVEPHPENIAALRTNLKLNSLSVKVVEAAAAVADGPVSLELRRGVTHRIVMPGTEGHRAETIIVNGISIPTILQTLGWSGIDLLKVDIEGYERVLFGGRPSWLRQVRQIVGEHHGSYGIPEIRADLEPLGFVVKPMCHRDNTFVAIRQAGTEPLHDA